MFISAFQKGSGLEPAGQTETRMLLGRESLPRVDLIRESRNWRTAFPSVLPGLVAARNGVQRTSLLFDFIYLLC
jgi:hypothetical protein